MRLRQPGMNLGWPAEELVESKDPARDEAFRKGCQGSPHYSVFRGARAH